MCSFLLTLAFLRLTAPLGFTPKRLEHFSISPYIVSCIGGLEKQFAPRERRAAGSYAVIGFLNAITRFSFTLVMNRLEVLLTFFKLNYLQQHHRNISRPKQGEQT
jgi:hypothetical protein